MTTDYKIKRLFVRYAVTTSKQTNISKNFKKFEQSYEWDSDVESKRSSNIREKRPNVVFWTFFDQFRVQLVKSKRQSEQVAFNAKIFRLFLVLLCNITSFLSQQNRVFLQRQLCSKLHWEEVPRTVSLAIWLYCSELK